MLYVVSILLTLGIFVLDLRMPLGYEVWLFYFFPLVVVSRTPRTRSLYFYTAVVTALMALGYLYSPGPPKIQPALSLLNRFLAAGVLWMAAVLVQRIRESTAELKKTASELQDETAGRRGVEERLRGTTETLRVIVEGSPLAVIVLDPAGKVLLWNPVAERTFGWNPEEVMGRDVPTVPENLREVFAELCRRAFQGESFSNLEARGLRKDGSQVNLLISTSPLRDAQGAIYGNLGVFTDITDRKKAEIALKETTRTLEELVLAAPAGITVLDPTGKVILWNPAMERILGWTEEEARGKVFPMAEAGQEGVREILERLQAGERLAEVELRRVRKDGRTVHLLLWTAPLRKESGRLKSTVVILLDVTRFKEMEQAALSQQKMASLGQLAAGISHEIRNPLSGINLHLHHLEKFLEEAELPNPEIREKTEAVITVMKGASAKMESVIQRVLSFSRPGPPRMEPLDVNLCIREAVDMARASLRKAGARVVIASQGELPACRGDIRLLEQALINLMTNAAQAMEGQEGERLIEISSSLIRSTPEYGYRVAVSVADSGPGVPKEVRGKIFDPFFTTKSSGTGIGLSITHKIITDHGGFIRVETSRCGGALFTIVLPAGDGMPSSASEESR